MSYFIGMTAAELATQQVTNTTNGSSTENQYGVITDLLCAGEIEGIVGGIGGVYLNGTSLLPAGDTNLLGRHGIVSVSGTTLTVPTGFFDGISLSDGNRYIQIKNAGTSITTSSALNAGTKLILLNSFTFNPAWTASVLREGKASSMDVVKYVIRIPGAGPDGTEYSGLITAGNNTQLTVYPPISTAVTSGTSVYVDGIAKIASIDSDTSATLNTSLSTVTNAPAILSYAVGNSKLEIAYDNIIAEVQRGSRYQALSETTAIANIPSASYLIGPNQDLSLHTAAGGTASTYNLSSSSFSFGQNSREEIDRVLLNMEFPGGLYQLGDQGENQLAVCEFQVTFKYKKSISDADWEEELVIGKDYGTNVDGTEKFYANIPAWPPNSERYQKALTNYLSNSRSYSTNTGMIWKTAQETPFIHQFSIDLTPFQPFADWQLTVKRLTPETTQGYARDGHTLVAKARLKTVEAQITDKLSYPTSAYSIVGFSAQDFDTPPARAFHLRGKKIKVPSNYFTREELGLTEAKYTRTINSDETVSVGSSYVPWDGTFRGDLTQNVDHPNFRPVYCNNPAWVYYDILTNTDYGLGEFIQEEDIDIYSLYQIARYCDELVDDGKGGQEPRFTCNVYLQRQSEAYKVLKDLASTFRSMIYWIDGKITLIQDKPKEPVYTFTQGNVENGVFEYTYTGQRARINQVNVTWNNPDEFYKQTVVAVDDVGNQIEQERIVSKDIIAFGCTSEGQAMRVGKWHLLTDTEETELVSFNTGINASFLRPGDIINIQDHNDTAVQFSGRVSSGSTTSSINLDREVTLDSGETYYLHLIIPEKGIYLAQDSATINTVSYSRGALLTQDADGNAISSHTDAINLVDDSGNKVETQFSKNSKVEKQVISSVGTVDSLTVSAAFGAIPASDTIWAISKDVAPSEQEIQQYRILSISEEDAGVKFSITASKFYLPKFDELETGYPVYIPASINTAGKDDEVPPPTELNISLRALGESQSAGTGTAQGASISWTPPTETLVDTNGASQTVPYRFIKGYEVHHNITQDYTANVSRVFVGPNMNQLDIPNVKVGIYTIKVRTINTVGAKSRWTTVTRAVGIAAPQAVKIGSVARGGAFSKQPKFNKDTGVFSLGDAYSYNFTSPSGEVYSGSDIDPTPEEVKQSFAILDNLADYDSEYSNVSSVDAYLFFDASEARIPHSDGTRDPWKVAIEHTDEVVQDIAGNETNFKYLKVLSSGSDLQDQGLEAITGTVSTTAGSSTLTGSGTSFSSELEVGQLIKVSSAAAGTEVSTAEYREIVEIESDTSLRVKTVFERDASGVYGLKRRYSLDYSSDCIVAKISRGPKFDIEWYATYPTGVTEDPKVAATLYAHFPLEKLEAVKTGTETIVTPSTTSGSSTITVTEAVHPEGERSGIGYNRGMYGSIDTETIGDNFYIDALVAAAGVRGSDVFIVTISHDSSPVPVDLFEKLTVTASGGTVTLYPKKAISNAYSADADTSGGSTYGRYWIWRQDIGYDKLSTWDGSGTSEVVFYTETASIGTSEQIATYDIYFKDLVSGKQATPSADADTLISTESPIGLSGSYSSTSSDGITILGDTDADALMGNAFSISLWAKFLETFSTNTDRTLIGRDDSEYFELLVRQSSSPELILKVKESSGVATYDGITIEANTWFNPIIAVDGSSFKLYLDGMEVASSDDYTPGSTDRPIVVGCHTEGSIATSTTSFVGQVAEVKFFSGVLGGTEAAAVSSSPKSISQDITYPDGTSLANLQPAEINADKTITKVNEGLTITESTGGFTLSEAGVLKTNGKDYGADSIAGVFLGYDTDAYKVNIGDSSQYIKYDGTNINISANSITGGTGDVTGDLSVGGDFDVTGDTTLTGSLSGSTITTTGNTTVGGDLAVTGNTVLTGNLTVNGTTTTLNSTTLTIDDKNIVLADGASGPTAADGAGITVSGANATILYDATNDEWDFNIGITAPYVQFTGGSGTEQGKVSWNTDEETLDVILNGATLQVGQEIHYHVRNDTASSIPNGTAVMATGTIGNSGRITIAPMTADGSIAPHFFIGVTTEDIGADEDGKVTHFGKVRGVDTSGFSDGDVLWLDPNNDGELTATKPAAPNLKIATGYVIHAHSNGTIFVRANPGIDLHNNHRVEILSPDVYGNPATDNQILQWNNTLSRWENVDGTTSNIAEGTNLYYTDARAISAIQGDSSWNATNWDTAYGWGNHALQNYLVTNSDGSVDSLTIGGSDLSSNSDGSIALTIGSNVYTLATTDDVFDGQFSSLTGTPTTISGYGITDAFDGNYSSLSGAPTNVSSFTNDANYLVTNSDGSVDSLTFGSATLTGNSDGSLGINTDLIPDTNIAYDLGSSTNRFNALYLSGSTIYLGDTTISANSDGTLSYTVGSNVYTIANEESATFDSATLTGTPTAPTAATGTDSTQIATTAFVKAAIDALKQELYAFTQSE